MTYKYIQGKHQSKCGMCRHDHIQRIINAALIINNFRYLVIIRDYYEQIFPQDSKLISLGSNFHSNIRYTDSLPLPESYLLHHVGQENREIAA